MAIFVLYLIPAVIAMWPSLAHPATVALQSGTGDPGLYAWGLAWTPWALTHGHDLFQTHLINVPYGVDLADSTLVPVLGFIMAPVTAIWGPIASLDVCWTLSFPLSAGAAYLLLRRFTTWRPAAFAGGLLYGFSPYMVAQGNGHLILVFVPIPPLIFLVLHELLVRQEGTWRRWGAVLGGLVAVQYFISSEVLATTALFAALTLVAVVVINPTRVRERIRHAVSGLSLAAAIALVLLVFPLYELLLGPRHTTQAVVGYRYYYSALLAPLLPTNLMLFGTHHLKTLGSRIGGNGSENGTYLGLPLLVVVAAAVVAIRSRVVRIAGVMVVVTFVLSLGDRLHVGVLRYASFGRNLTLPGQWIDDVPLLNQAFPVRYSVFIVLFVAVVFAVTLDALHATTSGRLAHSGPGPAHAASGPRHSRLRHVALPAVVAVVALVPLVPRWPYGGQDRVSTPPFFTTRDVDRIPAGAVTLVYPIATNLDDSSQLWQAQARFRFAMPGGYFVLPSLVKGQPPGYATETLVEETLSALVSGPAPHRTPSLRRRLRAELGTWGVRYVVAQPLPGARSFFVWLLGRVPDARLGAMLEWYRTRWTA